MLIRNFAFTRPVENMNETKIDIFDWRSECNKIMFLNVWILQNWESKYTLETY